MKATLEFDLTDRDESMAHLRCVMADAMAHALWEVQYNTVKRVMRDVENGREWNEALGDRISELMEDNGIKIDILTN